MSTTFRVFPGKEEIPKFSEVLFECGERFKLFLRKHKIASQAEVIMKIMTKNGDRPEKIDYSSKFKWDEDKYLWVTISKINGGTDGYFALNDDLDFDWWREEILKAKSDLNFYKYLENCILTGHHWSFRRSAGQPGAINIFYGVLAGTLALITDGVVFSDDSAWDYHRMPIKGLDFLENYMNPEKERTKEFKISAQSWIECAREELNV